MSKLEANALFYARVLNIPVFPLHGIVGGKCTCGFDCSSPGKHPILNGGPYKATKDYQTIFNWWKRWPSANIGIPTGSRSGLVVLDIDVKGDGFKTLSNLIRKNGGFDQTNIASTGSGGLHILFQNERGIKNKVRFANGLDFKSEGGYFVAPPSKHISGNYYLWKNLKVEEDFRVAQLPPWLKKVITDDRSFTFNTRKSKYSDISKGVKEGQRNNSLASLVGYLLNKGVDSEVTLNLARGWNYMNTPPMNNFELEKTFKSILKLHQKEG
ncbi:bifunctional DNA primase/polymerase [Alkalibacillus haloalkaliphilus]|uniref:bifunctional DNA primase/polymerase n=1 Tax=Alkalibacillus haloalkaliphilus TaxID=94136 RepID=UPI0002F88289|nr:bifunctional DNA primase/polymerase [Alkalibacillus haloalkaliphilus]